MKAFIFLISFLLSAFISIAQVETNAQLTTRVNNSIRNISAAKGITKAAVSDVSQSIIDSKVSLNLVRNRQTIDYTLVLTDNFKLIEINSATNRNVTVPPNASVAFTADFTQILIAGYGTGSVTIVPGAGVTIRSYNNQLVLSGQYAFATLIKIGTNEWYVTGNLKL